MTVRSTTNLIWELKGYITSRQKGERLIIFQQEKDKLYCNTMNQYLPISVVITYNTIHWMVIFPVDSVIHPLNWTQVIKRNFLHAQRHPIKGHNIHKHIKLSLPCEKGIWNTVNGMLGDLLQSIAGNPWVIPKMEIKREDIKPFYT